MSILGISACMRFTHTRHFSQVVLCRVSAHMTFRSVCTSVRSRIVHAYSCMQSLDSHNSEVRMQRRGLVIIRCGAEVIAFGYPFSSCASVRRVS